LPDFEDLARRLTASTVPIRLKLEINTSETVAFDATQDLLFRVNNPWFAGEPAVPAFSRAEILATKLRAVLQRY
jgi:Nucleotidyl transferase AbiEii toxin, Type IV TA system